MLGLDVNSAVRAVGDTGVEYIELWGEVPHAFPPWVDRRTLKDTLSTYRMALTLHAPFSDLNPANPFEPVRGAVLRTLLDFVKFGDFLGVKGITVHPGSVHNEGMVPRAAEAAVSTLRHLVKEADGRFAISIENQTKSRSKYHFPLASTTESLEVLLGQVDGTRFTLDTGHAHVNGIDPQRLAERLNSKLFEVHLHDNSGSSDDHLKLGEGTANIKGVLGDLASADVFMCLELDPHRYSEQEIVQALSETKATLGTASSQPTKKT